jgi:hypothetical protein
MNSLVVPKFHKNKESQVKTSIQKVKIHQGSKMNRLVQHSDLDTLSFLCFELVEEKK